MLTWIFPVFFRLSLPLYLVFFSMKIDFIFYLIPFLILDIISYCIWVLFRKFCLFLYLGVFSSSRFSISDFIVQSLIQNYLYHIYLYLLFYWYKTWITIWINVESGYPCFISTFIFPSFHILLLYFSPCLNTILLFLVYSWFCKFLWFCWSAFCWLGIGVVFWVYIFFSDLCLYILSHRVHSSLCSHEPDFLCSSSDCYSFK